MGYIMVVLFAILQNGAFQHDFIDFFMTPFMWYIRFCKWLVYPTYDNGFNQKIAYTGGEVWVIRILAIVAVLFIVGILIVIPSMSKTICLYFMLPPFPACIKITYYPAWIPYCNTIRRDRAGNYASSPYHAVFSYSDSGKKNTAAANPDVVFYLYRTCIGSEKCCLTFHPIRHKPFLWQDRM